MALVLVAGCRIVKLQQSCFFLFCLEGRFAKQLSLLDLSYTGSSHRWPKVASQPNKIDDGEAAPKVK